MGIDATNDVNDINVDFIFIIVDIVIIVDVLKFAAMLLTCQALRKFLMRGAERKREEGFTKEEVLVLWVQKLLMNMKLIAARIGLNLGSRDDVRVLQKNEGLDENSRVRMKSLCERFHVGITAAEESLRMPLLNDTVIIDIIDIIVIFNIFIFFLSFYHFHPVINVIILIYLI